MALHAREIRDATIVRIPGADEPELVGMGYAELGSSARISVGFSLY
jgi:hypothetical protein